MSDFSEFHQLLFQKLENPHREVRICAMLDLIIPGYMLTNSSSDSPSFRKVIYDYLEKEDKNSVGQVSSKVAAD